jgi:thiamine pyrophosphokinase
MRALVVGSGIVSDPELLRSRYEWADLVIAADGGAETLMQKGLKPHVVLGDFDSLDEAVLEKVKLDETIEILSFPVKKDYTDMDLAVDLAASRGASDIVIMGGSGTRLDHTFSNVMLLYTLLQKGIKGCLEDANNRIYLIKDTITVKRDDDRKVSLLPMTPTVEGVTTKGLEYPLKDAAWEIGRSLGVSNEFIEDEAVISIKKGLLLVFLSKD